MSAPPRYDDDCRRRLMQHVLPGMNGNSLVTVRVSDLVLAIKAADQSLPPATTVPGLLTTYFAEREDY